MKRRLVVTLAVGVVAALAVGFATRSNAAPAKKEAADQKTVPLFRIGFTPPIANLDQTRLVSGAALSVYTTENIVNMGADGKLHLWLADKVTQLGRKVYDYHLKKGIKFSDGTELTADDVATSLNYLRFPGSLVAYRQNNIKIIRALDRYTVRFILKQPDATFKLGLATPQMQIFQKKFFEEHKGTMGRPGLPPVGTGPWAFRSFDGTTGAELVANDHYWGGKPQIRRVSIKFFANDTSMALAFRAGEIDMASPGDPRAFEATSGTKLLSGANCGNEFFSMNTQVAPWNDIHVRRAVAYALNKPELVKARGGYAQPNATIIPRSQLLTLGSAAEVDAVLKGVPTYPYSLAKAKEELAKSAYPNGFSTTIVGLVGTWTTTSEAIAGQLAQVGIKATVQSLPLAAWFAATTGPNDKRPAAFLGGSCALPDVAYITTIAFGSKNMARGSFNLANYAPPDVDELLKAGLATSKPSKRLEIYGKFLKRAMTDIPYVPILTLDRTVALSDKFTWPTFKTGYIIRGIPLLEIKPK